LISRKGAKERKVAKALRPCIKTLAALRENKNGAQRDRGTTAVVIKNAQCSILNVQ